MDNFDLWLNIARSHALHQFETKRQYRTLWIQDKVKSQLIETLQLPVSHFFCLHLNQGKGIHVLYSFCNITTRICVLFTSHVISSEMYHRKQWLIWFNNMCLWNPDIYLEEILCLIFRSEKIYILWTCWIDKKMGWKKERKQLWFYASSWFPHFKAFLVTRKRNVGLGFCVLIFKERFLIHKYIWCQFPEPLLTYQWNQVINPSAV